MEHYLYVPYSAPNYERVYGNVHTLVALTLYFLKGKVTSEIDINTVIDNVLYEPLATYEGMSYVSVRLRCMDHLYSVGGCGAVKTFHSTFHRLARNSSFYFWFVYKSDTTVFLDKRLAAADSHVRDSNDTYLCAPITDKNLINVSTQMRVLYENTPSVQRTHFLVSLASLLDKGEHFTGENVSAIYMHITNATYASLPALFKNAFNSYVVDTVVDGYTTLHSPENPNILNQLIAYVRAKDMSAALYFQYVLTGAVPKHVFKTRSGDIKQFTKFKERMYQTIKESL